MMKFSLSLNRLEHGWATITVADYNGGLAYDISYVLGDALSGIVDTALALAKGQGSEIILYLEPERIVYKLEPQAEDGFRLAIGETEFHGKAKRYIQQVLHMFESYKFSFGANEYTLQWGHEFPAEQLAGLRLLI